MDNPPPKNHPAHHRKRTHSSRLSTKHGQVYECNSFSLTAALQEMHLQPQAIYKAEDDEQQIAALIQEAADSI